MEEEKGLPQLCRQERRVARVGGDTGDGEQWSEAARTGKQDVQICWKRRQRKGGAKA